MSHIAANLNYLAFKKLGSRNRVNIAETQAWHDHVLSVWSVVICPEPPELWSPACGLQWENHRRSLVSRENTRPGNQYQPSLSGDKIHSIYSFIKHIRPSYCRRTRHRRTVAHYIWIMTASYNQFMFKKSPGSIFQSVNIEADPSSEHY